MYPAAEVDLLKQKRVYSYDCVDSSVRLDEPALPPQEVFFNKLGKVECSQADYAHAQHVWDNFHCSNVKEYMALYLVSDILLLADMFQAFRYNFLDE